MKTESAKNFFHVIIFLFIFFCAWRPQIVTAEEAEKLIFEQEEQTSDVSKFKDGFSGDLRILSYGIIQEPSESSQNPGNNLIGISHYIANLEIRPDLRFDSDFLAFSVKPRVKVDYRVWEEGEREGETDWRNDWYVNEWLVRLKAGERLFISYGRENLQWGPSFLCSPSNPFFSDNGRSNPYMEVPGMDFGRLVFIPQRLWTISFIVNMGEGRNTMLGLDSFEETYAVKIDFTGRENYASLIFSQRDSDETWGLFGGWTASDALLLYAEGSLTKGSRALYAQKDMSLLGASMQKIHQDDSDVKPVVLAGASYTLENSGTLTLEYMYNAPGYSRDEADVYYDLRQDAAAAFNMGGLAELVGAYYLSQTGNPGMRFVRKNYAMLQYYQVNIKNKFDVTLRWTQNIDDGSGQFLGILSYALGNRWELFSTGIINSGDGDTEFGSILNYQAMFGVKFTL